jgi:putative restriction endonuclease
MEKNNWTRNEHVVAFNLYCKIPFTKINSSNKKVQELSTIIGRSIGSVAMKLANFARLDPALQARNISGLTQGAKGEEDVWHEFNGNWEELAYESERILAQYQNNTVERSVNIYTDDLPPDGKEREAIVKVRVNQSFFRNAVLASYDNKCCITGIAVPELLIAGHIIPWSIDQNHRTNPANGLCLNALHDKAFDKGLITITEDFRILVSEKLLSRKKEEAITNYFVPYHKKEIIKPNRFLPDIDFLKYHRSNIFIF